MASSLSGAASPASYLRFSTSATHLLDVVSKGNREGLGRHSHSLFIAFQSTVLIFQGLLYVRRALPYTILCSVCSLLVAVGDGFLPQPFWQHFVPAHSRKVPDRTVGNKGGG